MPAGHKLIHDSAFDADTVKMMGEVFDAAWGTIGPAFRGLPQATIDNARTVLASNIIQGVRVGLVHPEALKNEAIAAVRQRFPSLRI
jgi:hypothetical protein